MVSQSFHCRCQGLNRATSPCQAGVLPLTFRALLLLVCLVLLFHWLALVITGKGALVVGSDLDRLIGFVLPQGSQRGIPANWLSLSWRKVEGDLAGLATLCPVFSSRESPEPAVAELKVFVAHSLPPPPLQGKLDVPFIERGQPLPPPPQTQTREPCPGWEGEAQQMLLLLCEHFPLAFRRFLPP